MFKLSRTFIVITILLLALGVWGFKTLPDYGKRAGTVQLHDVRDDPVAATLIDEKGQSELSSRSSVVSKHNMSTSAAMLATLLDLPGQTWDQCSALLGVPDKNVILYGHYRSWHYVSVNHYPEIYQVRLIFDTATKKLEYMNIIYNQGNGPAVSDAKDALATLNQPGLQYLAEYDATPEKQTQWMLSTDMYEVGEKVARKGKVFDAIFYSSAVPVDFQTKLASDGSSVRSPVANPAFKWRDITLAAVTYNSGAVPEPLASSYNWDADDLAGHAQDWRPIPVN